jgi:hypothetical protein
MDDKVLEAATSFAQRCGVSRAAFATMIQGSTSERQLAQLTQHEVIIKTLKLHRAVALGGAAGAPELPRISALDAWTLDEALTRRHKCRCDACDGVGSGQCQACEGSERMKCPECRGGGRVPGQRGMKNCPTCRARGDVKCKQCKKGVATCKGCEGLGCVEAWVEVVTGRRVEGHVEPTSRSLEGFEAELETWSKIEDTGWVDVSDPAVPAARVKKLGSGERILRGRAARFERFVDHVQYALPTGSGVVCVMRSTGEVLGESESWPLEARRRRIWRGMAGVLASALAVVIWAATRGAWYQEHSSSWWFAALALVGSVMAWPALRGLTLPSAARGVAGTWAPAAGCVTAFMCVPLLALLGPTPTLDHASAALSGGDLAAARQEASALTQTGQEGRARALLGEVQRVEDERHDGALLERAREARGALATLDVYEDKTWRSPARRETVGVMLRVRVQDDMSRSEQTKNISELMLVSRRLEAFDAKLAGEVEGLYYALHFDQCHEAFDADCMVEGMTQASARHVPALRYERMKVKLREHVSSRFAADMKAALEVAQLDDRYKACVAFKRRHDACVKLLGEDVSGVKIASLDARMSKDAKTIDARDAALERKRVAEEAREERKRVAARAREERARRAEEAREERVRRAEERRDSWGGKSCNKGCPCGNTCISCKKVCHK